MIFDTGSDRFVAKTWATVLEELKQVDPDIADYVVPVPNKIYNRANSSTYKRLFTTDKHGKKAPKQGYIAYGSGSAITDEGNETVLVGGRDLTDFPLSEITQDTLSMLHAKNGAGGVLGLQ